MKINLLSFRTDGSAAVKIGQQLEMAEAKRRQCENASVLIRRWWLMENLAEKDAMESINVEDEVGACACVISQL